MIKIDRRLIKNIDFPTFLITVILSVIGIMTIYSATRPILGSNQPDFYIKQIIWLILSITILVFFVSFDYIWLGRLSTFIYITGVILLALVFLMGKTGMGAQRWLKIGPISFQPSEFFKIIYIIMLSHFLSLIKGPIDRNSLLKIFLYITIVPLILLIKQPDLGTSLIIIIIFFSLIILKGISRRLLFLMIIIGIISLPFLGHIFWEGLKDYQKERIIAFVDPDVDPSGIGYQLNQSKITIGSGKLLGKGYLKGTQGPFRFLPEKHTDFIFAVFAEEWGFIGSTVLIILYALLILRGLDTANKAKDDFGRFLSLGICLMFITYTTINIGMTLGLMPVVGIPLPFMSYGGTALVSNFIAIGILINIRTRRFELFH